MENRKEHRAKKRIPAMIKKGKKHNHGLTTDLSFHGIGIICQDLPETMVFTIGIKEKNMPVTLACEKVWHHTINLHGKDVYHVGARIINANMSYLDLMDKLN